MKLLLQRQPVARDLRPISAALKMISDMERIGDQAEDIAEIAWPFLDRRQAESDALFEGNGPKAVIQHGHRQRGRLCAKCDLMSGEGGHRSG
ncbi:MAG: PhoU domain-containing protein [Dysosmobacter sp.]